MKTTIKIIILVLAVTFAIGGVMIYAKTRVSPPVSINQKDAYSSEVSQCVKSLSSASSAFKEDSTFNVAIDRVETFSLEDKLEPEAADKNLDNILGSYTPKFLFRCFEKFGQSEWNPADHTYMLSQRARLLGITHHDMRTALRSSTIDSLKLISDIIGNYREAQRVSRATGFYGVSNAQQTISTANRYMRDKYLSHCTSLVSALSQVRVRIGDSWYRQVSSQVDKLANYAYYSKEYYNNTLVNQVDRAVTEYDNRAAAIVGSKKNVDALWSRARNYYNQASSYYDYNQ